MPSDPRIPPDANRTTEPGAADPNAPETLGLGGTVAHAPAPAAAPEPDEDREDSKAERFRLLVEQDLTGATAEQLVDRGAHWLEQQAEGRAVALPPWEPDPNGPRSVPDGFLVDGRPPDIAIDPGERQFEPAGDWVGWLVHASPYWPRSETLEKPPFRFARAYDSGFIYPLALAPAPAASSPQAQQQGIRVALFSDFGTGLYPSRYIIRHMRSLRPEVAVHLGDVYYAGTKEDFQQRFTPVVEPLLDKTEFYVLAGNHELLSGGHNFFAYIDEKRRPPAQGMTRRPQPQEGSYFCLRTGLDGPRYQIIGIDTEYFEERRYRHPELQGWLHAVLDYGRRHEYTNILLTSDVPYEIGRKKRCAKVRELTPLLCEDLWSFVVTERLVDLWFWGDNHYCALFAPNEQAAPFIGSCIGHGGFPYARRSPRDENWPFTKVLFFETAGRFPDATGLRPDRGNNGFALVTLKPQGITLEYVDWLKRLRCRAELLRQAGGRLAVGDVIKFPA